MVVVKLKKGASLQPLRDLIQGKQRKEVFRTLRGVLFFDRFDRPPWYKTTGVVVKFTDFSPPQPEDLYSGQRNILFFAYHNEFKAILKKLFNNEDIE